MVGKQPGRHAAAVIICHCSLDALRVRDEHIKRCLTEKQQMFAALYENAAKRETPHKGLLLRGDASELQQGETLLVAAIHEGKSRGVSLSWVTVFVVGQRNIEQCINIFSIKEIKFFFFLFRFS